MAGIFDQITGRAANNQDQATEQDNRLETDLAGDSHSEEIETQSTFPEPNAKASEQDALRTDKRLREVSQELLRYGLLEEAQKPNRYRVATTNLQDLNNILEPLDFFADVDEIRGLIFLAVKKPATQDELDEWAHPLVRKQRLTLEQSLLVAILRQYFIAYEQESGTGASEAVLAVDELIPQLQVYLGDTGSEAKERNRVLHLLDQLKGHGLVSSPDTHDRITIRPMIAHLANPENLQALLKSLRDHVNDSVVGQHQDVE